MNVALRRRVSLEEFLAWEARQELRHELDGSGLEIMVAGSIRYPDGMAVCTRGDARIQWCQIPSSSRC